MPPRDTSPAAQARQRDVFRHMTPERRLALAAEMSDEIRSIAESGIRARHPAWSEDEVRSQLASMLHGPQAGARLRTRPIVPGR